MDSSRKAKENPSLKSIHPVWKGRMDSEGTGQVHTPHMDEIIKLQEETDLATPLHTPRMEGAYGSAARFSDFFPSL